MEHMAKLLFLKRSLSIVLIGVLVLLMSPPLSQTAYAKWPTANWNFDIQSVSLSSPSLTIGNQLVSTVTVKNTGGQLGTVMLALCIQRPDGSKIYPDSKIIYDIPVGSSKNTNLTYSCSGPTGNYKLNVDMYNLDASHMFDTTGYIYTFSVLPPPNPDLTIPWDSLSAPSSASPGQSITVSFSVKNQGGGSSGSFYNGIYIATAQYGTQNSVGSFSMTSISAGSTKSDSRTVTIPSGLSPGNYWVSVFADYNDAVTESNENNNIASNAITILPPPNPDLVSGTTGSLLVYSKDENGSTVGGKKLILYDSAYVQKGQATTSSGGSFQWDGLAAGTYNVELYDSNGDFWGAASQAVTVGNTVTLNLQRTQPWLPPGNVSSSPSNKTVGRTVHIDATVRNGAGFARNARVELIIDRGQSSAWDYSEEHGPVNINAGNTGSFGWDFTPSAAGTYYVKVVVKSNPSSTYTPTDTSGWEWQFTVSSSAMNLPENSTVNGTIQFSGITWNKIDWKWNAGLSNGNVIQQDGDLILRANKNTGIGAQLESTSSDYGYGEYNAKIGSASTLAPEGVCQAFFYYFSDSEEIDIEILSGKPGYVYYTVQTGDTFRVKVPNQQTKPHDYGFVWQKDKVTFYLDGKIAVGDLVSPGGMSGTDKVWQSDVNSETNKNIPSHPGKIVMNNWSGNSWAGNPPSTDLDMQVSRVSYASSEFVNSATARINGWTSPVTVNEGDTITTSGTIIGTGSGTVTYHWETSTGTGNWASTGLDFTTSMSNGSATISSKSVTQVAGTCYYRVVVTSPNSVTGNEVQVNVRKPVGKTGGVIANISQDHFLPDAPTKVTVLVNNTGAGGEKLILVTSKPSGWLVEYTGDNRDLYGDCNPYIEQGKDYHAEFTITAPRIDEDGTIVWEFRDDVALPSPMYSSPGDLLDTVQQKVTIEPHASRGYVLYIPGVSLIEGESQPDSDVFRAGDRAVDTFPIELRTLSTLQQYTEAFFSYRYVSGGGYGGPNAQYTWQETQQALAISAEAMDLQIRGLINDWRETNPGTSPEIVIICHSLGGAVTALWASDAREQELAFIRTVFTLDSPVAGQTPGQYRRWFGNADNDLRNQNTIDKMEHGTRRLDFAQVGNCQDIVVPFDQSFTGYRFTHLALNERIEALDFSAHSTVLKSPTTRDFIQRILGQNPPEIPPLWSSGGRNRPGPWGTSTSLTPTPTPIPKPTPCSTPSFLPVSYTTQFTPEKNGWLFDNNWISYGFPYGFGMCAGMSYSALDFYYAGVPIKQVDKPAIESSLFAYIRDRQIPDSLRILKDTFDYQVLLQKIAVTLIAGTNYDSENTYSIVKSSLKDGKPIVINLRATSGLGWEGHVVVAYALDEYDNQGKRVSKIMLYDPNVGQSDSPYMRLTWNEANKITEMKVYTRTYSSDFWNAFGTSGMYTPQVPAKNVLTAKASEPPPSPSSTTGPGQPDTVLKPRLTLDLNGDGVVDERDTNAILTLYGKKKGDPGFGSEADLNGDGQIDLMDLALMTARIVGR